VKKHPKTRTVKLQYQNKTAKQLSNSGNNGYGHRWTATEGVFSAIKRVFGEQVRATSETGMLHEAASKIWAYQKIQRA